ncbi:MAG: hypothetical protein ACKVOX_03380, partial [Rhizobacter sp.]
MSEAPDPGGDLSGRHIVLGLSGGIACYKAAELARALVKAGATCTYPGTRYQPDRPMNVTA